MSKAAEMTDLTRGAALAWIEREERRTGSRMAAYEVVASMFGASPDWLRKFVRGTEAKQPDWTVGWNILASYQRLCARIEREAQADLDKARILREAIDAATEGFDFTMDGETRTEKATARLPASIPPEAV